MSQVITQEVIEQAMTYTQYRELIDKLLAEDKTTGENHTPAMLDYTKMNVQRMKRGDKTFQLKDSLAKKLSAVPDKWYWIVLTEAWCGDAAQNIPPLVKMAEASDNIEIRFILRDDHLEIMDEYLTNGGRSIPKLVCLNASDLKELGSWGPRPQDAQRMVLEMKAQEINYKEAAEKLHGWYAKNKAQDIQKEFEELADQWIKA